MFDQITDRYDLLNDVLSFGFDRWWRHRAVGAVRARRGDRVLDLGCGTGLLGRAAARRTQARVVGVDVSHAMLVRAARLGREVATVEGSAFRLPFRDGAFAAACSAFVMRNLDDLDGAFRELARVVRPGGGIALVDITEPPRPALRRLFDLYFRVATPAMGALVGRREAYAYLTRSLVQLPDPRTVVRLLEGAGFERARCEPLTGGIAVLFTARRRSE